MFIKRCLFPLTSLALLLAALLYPFAQSGISYSDDILVTIYRVFGLRQSWDAGILYPRIAPDLAFGYGAPLFQYYPPLSTYLAAFMTLLGVGIVDAVKLTFAMVLFLGGAGAFVYAHGWSTSVPVGWLTAVVYVAAPYQLANIYVRGATAEALAIALFPWILWSVYHLFRSSRPWFWLCWMSLLVATLLMSHNALSLFFMPVLLVVCLLDGWQSGKWKRLALSLIAILLALASSAFFWLPALLERNQVNINAMTAGYYDPIFHLKPLDAVIQHTWAFQYDRPQVYSFGWLLLGVSLCAAVLIWRQHGSYGRWVMLALLLITGSLLLQLPVADPFWRDLPLVRFIQFPWRLFAFASLAASMLIGALPMLFQENRKLEWATALAIGFIVVIYSFSTLPMLYNNELTRDSFTNEMINHRDLYERGKIGFELFSDYQPLTMQIPMTDVPNTPSFLPTSSVRSQPLPAIQLHAYQGLTLRATIESTRTTQILLNRFFMPGWRATVDGQANAIYPSAELGLVTTDIPAGRHELMLTYGATPLRAWASRLSLLALGLLLFLFVTNLGMTTWGMTTWRAIVMIAFVGSVLLFGRKFVPQLPFVEQNYTYPTTGQVGDFAELLGYSLDQTSYQPGDTIQLTLFWRARQAVSTEYKVFVHLRDMADTQMIAQHDGAPVYGFTPTTRWLPGEILDDLHPLPLDKALAPGTYQLAVGMYEPISVTNLPVSAEKTVAGQRIVLGTITVR